MMMTFVLTIVSLAVDAPLRDHSNPNLTPNPAKAPWYFLGLQEQLHYFPPTVAGWYFCRDSCWLVWRCFRM